MSPDVLTIRTTFSLFLVDIFNHILVTNAFSYYTNYYKWTSKVRCQIFSFSNIYIFIHRAFIRFPLEINSLLYSHWTSGSLKSKVLCHWLTAKLRIDEMYNSQRSCSSRLLNKDSRHQRFIANSTSTGVEPFFIILNVSGVCSFCWNFTKLCGGAKFLGECAQ